MERAVEFYGMGTKDDFFGDYKRLTVVLTISLLPRLSQKEITNKFNWYELKQEDLRE